MTYNEFWRYESCPYELLTNQYELLWQSLRNESVTMSRRSHQSQN